jgi:Thioredoxin
VTGLVSGPTAPVGAGGAAPPPVVGRERYESALTFAQFLGSVSVNADLWRAVYAHATVSDEAAARAVAIGGHWHILVLAEDWCGDAVNTLPVIARLVERAPNLDLRILLRDANLDLMDSHLTNGARSIPVAIVLREDYSEQGWWGPRPRELQAWVMGEGRALDKAARYREVRAWYARDKGQSTVREVLELIDARR